MKIYKETPSGVIDGINKSFTFINEVSQIDDLWVDNVIYTGGYTISNKIITLTDAPTLSIYADYLTGGSEIPVTTNVTFGDIKSKVWSLLGQKPTSTNFSNDIVGLEINTVGSEVFKGRVINLLNPQQIIRAGNLWFKEGDFSLRVKSGGAVTQEAIIGDTEIKTKTNFLLPSGEALVGGDIISYNGITSDSITGVTGITTTHLVGEKVTQLYQVPANFEKIIGLDLVISTAYGIRYESIPLEDGVVSYDILRKGTDEYLLINGLDNNKEVRVHYSKKYEDLTVDSQINPFPDKYGISVIAYLVAGGLAYDKGMPSSERLLNRAYSNLRAMYQYYNNKTEVISQSLKPKHYSFRKRRGGNIIQ